MQYAGLMLYVAAEASDIRSRCLALAKFKTINIQGVGDVGVIPAAAVTTLDHFRRLDRDRIGFEEGFFLSRCRFLNLAMIAAVALIVVSMIFGLHVGIWFVWAMVVLASGYILYHTSNVLAPISHRSICSGVSRAVRVVGLAILVRPATIHAP